MTDENTQDDGNLYGEEFDEKLVAFNMTATQKFEKYNTEAFGDLPPDVQKDLRHDADDLLKLAAGDGSHARTMAREAVINHGIMQYNDVMARYSEIESSGQISALNITEIRKRRYDHPEEDTIYHLDVEFNGREDTIELRRNQLLNPTSFKLAVMEKWDAKPEMPDADQFEDHIAELMENSGVVEEERHEHRPEHFAAQEVIRTLDMMGVTRDAEEFKKGQKLLHDPETNELHADLNAFYHHMSESAEDVRRAAVANVLRRWGYFGDGSPTSRIKGSIAWTFDQGRLLEQGAISKRDLRALEDDEE